MPNALQPHRSHGINAREGTVVIALCTHRTETGDRTEWSYYAVDDSVRKTLIDLSTHEFKVKSTFLSEDGKKIAVAEEKAAALGFHHFGLICPWAGRGNSRINHGTNSINNEALFLICPMLMESNTAFHIGQYYLPAVEMPITLTFSLEEVKSLSKVECRLVR